MMQTKVESFMSPLGDVQKSGRVQNSWVRPNVFHWALGVGRWALVRFGKR
jgi:hypothetical protein